MPKKTNVEDEVKTEVEPTIEPAQVDPAPTPAEEPMVKKSDVAKMIAEAIANSKEADKPIKAKRVTEHHAHIWRLDGKWVVDFKDRNTDPYQKDKVHAFQKFNEQRREFEAWIELVFDDGTTKEIPLTTYVKNRFPVYCLILKRHQVDKTYSIGEVEKKKEVGDKLVGTGVVIDQEVTMSEEVFEVQTPKGEVLKLPGYIIA